MAPYQRRRYNYYRPYWNKRRRRFRKPRSRNPFRRRRRQPRVRRRRYRRKFKKKLKKLNIQQWQPTHIKKCKIQGYLELFECGKGRVGNNYAAYKDSWVPPHEPSGGGWSLQQLTLNNLYVQNCLLMNWWTRSNKGLNLVRILGVKVTLFRQENIDYIFCYLPEEPSNVTKYYYPSFHPIKMLTYNNKIVVPSFRSQPHKKKPYKKKFIPPPKEYLNKWYFQQHLGTFPLLQFVAVACSLTNPFISPESPNNNVTLYCLNTSFFTHPNFQTYDRKKGYISKENQYIYASDKHTTGAWDESQVQNCTYLANTLLNDPGDTIGNKTDIKNYSFENWGNPFYYEYLTGETPTFITTTDINSALQLKKTDTVKKAFASPTIKTEPYIKQLRYNPHKDKGKGNRVYWIQNNAATQTNWEPTRDPDLMITDFPLWILLYGWEDFSQKIGKVKNLNQDWILVINCPYLDDKIPYVVILSEHFVYGQGPYDVGRDELSLQDKTHWYPRFRYQREAVDSIINTGPGICKFEHQKNIHAHMKYEFILKWGGNPSSMEQVYDPAQQPIYPMPGGLQSYNEITDPTTPISNYIYQWDTRRDFLTQAAQQRIAKINPYEQFMFTDGAQTSTEIPLQIITQTPPKTTSEKEEEEILQQLIEYRRHNQQLQHRFQQLKLMLESSP
ncbi:MAG: hypothetical protein QKC62_gp1 [Anelloviridae sp.]|uniref:Capsid protein n=1 Tax=Anelloviridae sp. TaxID=2055263 RepID=A0A385E220_9VIRU|nr:MAG: hypothetical protein QKC62_gp1 [Anelloviridae sp.]AXQ65811.1 MAG: hypothetical protein [Anelloviridae sp.]